VELQHFVQHGRPAALDRMRRESLLLGLVAAAVSMSGCIAVPDPADQVVARYQQFLAAEGTPFAERVKRNLWLTPEDDIRAKQAGFWSRLGPSRGAAMPYGVVTFLSVSDAVIRGEMSVHFDPSVVCVSRKHLSVLGALHSSFPMPPSPHMPLNSPRMVVPESVQFKSSDGVARLEVWFHDDCLEKISHPVRIPIGRTQSTQNAV